MPPDSVVDEEEPAAAASSHEKGLPTDDVGPNAEKEVDSKPPPPLTGLQLWNLGFCLLAWGFTVANVTMGTYRKWHSVCKRRPIDVKA